MLNIPVNSFSHVGTVSSPYYIFYLGKLDKHVNRYFVHILLLVTDNNPAWISLKSSWSCILSQRCMYKGGGQSRDTHVVISHFYLPYALDLSMFYNYFLAFWWISELTPSAEYQD